MSEPDFILIQPEVLFHPHPEPLDLLVFLLSHGAQLVLVLTGQLLSLDMQGGAAALACDLKDGWTRQEGQRKGNE